MYTLSRLLTNKLFRHSVDLDMAEISTECVQMTDVGLFRTVLECQQRALVLYCVRS
jgi:hypothetical protein